MSQRNRTESRRFICLIDSLYDHKIRVIASGADDYWNLFQVLTPKSKISGAKTKLNVNFQNEEISQQQRLDESRMLIDDLGLKASDKGSLDRCHTSFWYISHSPLFSGVFSGEEELFAFDRTVSRLTEMQTKDYWKKWKSYIENR